MKRYKLIYPSGAKRWGVFDMYKNTHHAFIDGRRYHNAASVNRWNDNGTRASRYANCPAELESDSLEEIIKYFNVIRLLEQ